MVKIDVCWYSLLVEQGGTKGGNGRPFSLKGFAAAFKYQRDEMIAYVTAFF
jgi:hypothetical protein